MAANELKNVIKKLDNKNYETFLEHNNSNLILDRNDQGVEFDNSWIDAIEELIPHMDEIVRNPKRFIVQEEEVVRIEMARKITQDSIKHLSQHTSYIQKFDPKTGDVTPNKILNVRKEETVDIYENRFVYSLLLKIREFMSIRQDITSGGAFAKSTKKIDYEAETNFDSEKVKIRINVVSAKEDKTFDNSSYKERLAQIDAHMSDFTNSTFFKSLKGAIVVKSPIRKTNAILKNPHFKKCLEVWEKIERFDVMEKQVLNNHKKERNPIVLKENMDDVFMLTHTIIDKNDGKGMNPKVSRHYIHKLISNFLRSTKIYDEVEFKKIMLAEFEKIRKEEKKKDEQAKRAIDLLFQKFETSKKHLLNDLNIF